MYSVPQNLQVLQLNQQTSLVPINYHRLQEHPISFHLREEPSLHVMTLEELNLRDTLWKMGTWWIPKKVKDHAVTLTSEHKTFPDGYYKTQ